MKKKKINLILNLGNISSYKNNKNYLGATCGRYANRIKKAQFQIKGVKYKLTRNEGKNILHGGKKGFDSKIWQVKSFSKSHISYYCISPDKDQGFPGELYSSCDYSIANSTLKINISAQTSKTTHVNLVNHAYWNLDKIKKDIFDHHVQINSNHYLENDRENIPTDKHLSLYNMGLSLIFLEDLVPAQDYFLKALKYLPNHSDSLHWIAYIYFKKGQLSVAQDH